MYLVRASREGTNEDFYANEYGYNNVDLNMPNCTDQCLKRNSEIANKNVKKEMFTGATGNAKDWAKNCHWQNGKKIKVGATLVFNGTYGHVLTIEDIIEKYSDTHCKCLISQSNHTRKASVMEANFYQSLIYDIEIGKVTKGVGLIPTDCIYNPYVDDKRVERNTNKNQIEITYNRLKARHDNGDWYKGRYIPVGIYNVIQKAKKTIDNVEYDCVKLDNDCWCALVEGCYKLYNKEKPTQDDKLKRIEEYANKITELCK